MKVALHSRLLAVNSGALVQFTAPSSSRYEVFSNPAIQMRTQDGQRSVWARFGLSTPRAARKEDLRPMNPGLLSGRYSMEPGSLGVYSYRREAVIVGPGYVRYKY